MLAVVDPVAGAAVLGGERPPAGDGPRLDDDDAGASLDERGGGAQPGAAGADDDHIGGSHGVRAGDSASTPARSSVLVHVAAAIQARSGRGTRITSRNTS